MSGGVDSSVTAALLLERGYEVIGVTLRIWPYTESNHLEEKFGTCCSPQAVFDARSVAQKLGFPHYTLNMVEEFENEVIEPFCREYLLGRTPNPCIECNKRIKFGVLLKRALGLGVDYVATGHYAKVEYDELRGRYILRKGKDVHKDQSYALYNLTQDRLKHILLPLGDYTKDEIRDKANELDLAVAHKAESQEICFIPDSDYRAFLKGRVNLKIEKGYFVDKEGNILGEHRGYPFYTIGQRRGLGISHSRPLYVIDIDKNSNIVTLSFAEDTFQSALIASPVNWLSIARPEGSIRAKAKIRYRSKEAESTITPLSDDAVLVKFDEPQRAIAPGQSVVFYEDELVLGGGVIKKGDD